MKKLVPVILILIVFASLASCKDNNENPDKVLETADSAFSMTGNSGGVLINESTVKTMLGAFSPKVLGIDKEITEYSLKLSATIVFERDACLVEAYPDSEAKTPVATFAVAGTDCFVYDKEKGGFLLLTAKGTVSVAGNDGGTTVPAKPEDSVSAPENSATVAFSYDRENNEKLQKYFAAYTPEQLGLQKPLDTYILIATGTTTLAKDKKTVYIVRCYEKSGEATNYTMAFNENGYYHFDSESGKYVKLK